MVSSVKAISKILVVLKLTGCFPFYLQVSEYRIKKSDKNYKVFPLIMFLITQISSVFLLYAAISNFATFFPWKIKNSSDNTNQVFEAILCVSVYSLMQILCVINYSRFIAIINDILEIDSELKRKFRREVDNSKLETFNVAVLIYITVHTTLLMITFSDKVADNKFNLSILAYLFQLTMSAAYVVFFTSVVKLTVARLKVVNGLFQTVSAKPDEDLKSFFQVVEIYKLVEKTFGVIDDCNGLVLLFYLAYVFYTLTNEIYSLAFMILDRKEEVLPYVNSIMWIIHQVWILWELSMNCGVVPSEAKKTAQTLSRIYGKGKGYQNMIDKFLTKSIKQEIKFTAYGFFVIDNSTLFKIVSAVTTYLVILIQFKQLEDSKNTV